MSTARTTLERVYTDEDIDFAKAVIRAVAANGGEVYTQAEMSRLSGVPRGRLTRTVMTLARVLVADVFPGQALLSRNEGPKGTLYRLTDDTDLAVQAHLRIAKTLHTMTRRAHAEAEPLRGHTELAFVSLVDLVDSLWANLSSREHTYDAILTALMAEPEQATRP